MEREVTYKMENGYIVAWDGNNGYTPVAKVINGLHCNVIVRTLEFAEDCEDCIDKGSDYKGFRDCFKSYIGDVLRERNT